MHNDKEKQKCGNIYKKWKIKKEGLLARSVGACSI